jgi:imidazolonepropionase-like amidohydrolase
MRLHVPGTVLPSGEEHDLYSPAGDDAPDDERARASARAELEPGVLTDAGMVPHGMVSSEIGLLHESGIPAAAALAAGSWDARSFLGLPGIEEGAPADLVGFARDPREELAVLSEPALVVLDGVVVRTAERIGDG